MEEEAAATRIQSLVRGWLARRRLIDVVNTVYERAYDEGSGHFFYFNRRTGESSWTKPSFLRGDADVALTPRSQARFDATATEAAGDAGADETPAFLADEDGEPTVDLSSTAGGRALARFRVTFDLAAFLEEHGLDRFHGALVAEGFEDAEALLEATTEDLAAVGLRTGHRRVLMRALAGLRERMAAAGVPLTEGGAVDTGGGEPLAAGASDGDLPAGWDEGEARDRADGTRTPEQSAAGRGGPPSPLVDAESRAARLSMSSRRWAERAERLAGSRTGLSREGSRRGDSRDGRRFAEAEAVRSDEIVLEVIFPGHDTELPHEGQVVRMHYEGRLSSGHVFESSRDRGRAFQFRIGAGQVIRGLEYAVTQLTRGTRARFRVPPELAYGAAGRLPKIPPNAPLEFEVQIIDFYTPDVDLTPRDDFEEA